MEIMTFLAVCFGGYWIWAKQNIAKKKERGIKIEAEVYNAIQSIMMLNDSNASVEQGHRHISDTLIRLIKNIETIRSEDSILIGSFAHNYLVATMNGDEGYTHFANAFISKRIITSSSLDECTLAIMDFMLRPPLPEYNYILNNQDVVNPKYSAQYMADMDTLLKYK